MSDEIKNENGTIVDTEEPKEQKSPSIFDKPDHSGDKIKKKIPVWATVSISVVLCAVLVCSAVFIPKMLKNSDTDTSSGTSQAEVTITLCDYGKYIDIIGEAEGLDKGGVKNIVYSVGGTDFNIIQGKYKETSTDAKGKTVETEKVGWTIDNYEGVQWNNENISGLVQNALTVTAITKMTDNAENLAVYGLDDKNIFSRITVNFNNNESYSVLAGVYSSDRSGRYIKFADSNAVYLSSYSEATYMSLEATDMPQKTLIGRYESTGKDSSYFSDNELTYFDAMYVFGRKCKDIITFIPSNAEDTFTSFKMMTPVEAAAEDEEVSELLSILKSGINAQSVLEFMPDDETIKSYGLQFNGDDNNLKIMIIISGVVHKFEIGNELEDGSFPVMVNSSRVIYKADKSEIPFIDKSYTDYMRSNLFLANITTMKSVSVKGSDFEETFNIKNTPKDDSGESFEQTVTNKNGKILDDTVFKDFLSYFQRLTATSYDNEKFGNTDKKPCLTITFGYSDKNKEDTVVTFYPFSDRRYLYKINGGGNALISITEYNQIVEKAKAAVKAVK